MSNLRLQLVLQIWSIHRSKGNLAHMPSWCVERPELLFTRGNRVNRGGQFTVPVCDGVARVVGGQFQTDMHMDIVNGWVMIMQLREPRHFRQEGKCLGKGFELIRFCQPLIELIPHADEATSRNAFNPEIDRLA